VIVKQLVLVHVAIISIILVTPGTIIVTIVTMILLLRVTVIAATPCLLLGVVVVVVNATSEVGRIPWVVVVAVAVLIVRAVHRLHLLLPLDDRCCSKATRRRRGCQTWYRRQAVDNGDGSGSGGCIRAIEREVNQGWQR
jgi:hypothetical protein